MLPSIYYRLQVNGLPIQDESGNFTPRTHWGANLSGKYIPLNMLTSFAVLHQARILTKRNFAQVARSSKSKVVSEERTSFKRTLLESEGLFAAGYLHKVLSTTEFSDQYEQHSKNIPQTYLRSAWLDSDLVRHHVPQALVETGLLSDPYHLTQYAYENLYETANEHGLLGGEFIEALSLFTLGLIGIFPRSRCQLCFRHAVPQEMRCRYHSQDMRLRNKSGSSPAHSKNSAAAQKARTVVDKLDDWDGYLPLELSDGRDADLCTLASCLWGPLPFLNPDLLRQIDLAISCCPRVVQTLPIDFSSLSSKDKIFALQDALDPQEYDVSFWPEKIYIAEEWLTVKEQKSPGRKKRSDINLDRVARARLLLKQGHKQKDVADQLGIDASYLSRLLRRIPEK
jgi:hypothetical protein